ncbi:uncharacterized protein LTR77_010700 [Saxophila tyrrhenica]|uniref:ASST-domain-containing protein n=1 Tax=Saxophila tyrrhenica TaxID=1690608 RepID=A0AAV9NUV6_9PEZI|nr:hypothetical protein LTR77_010700 [Saxophila tyrrhenica]
MHDWRRGCLLIWLFFSLLGPALGSLYTGVAAGEDLQRFASRPDLMPPKWDITYHDRSKLSPGYWFVAPYRFSDNHLDDVKWTPCEVGPMIFDNDGELVWSGACQFSNRITFDFDMVQYQGKPVLKGNLKHSRFPKSDCGAGYFLNSQYEMEHSVLLAKDIDLLNQHEFNVEADGHRTLITTHRRDHIDAKNLGLDGKVWVRTDGFREIDTETGEMIFDWVTHEHVSLNESSFKTPSQKKIDKISRSGGWDAYHTNSATKNSDGDYLVSVRHTDTLFLVSGKDGRILWRCGGKQSDFKFEKGAKFSRQHHARYLEHNSKRSVISLMDNAVGDLQQDKQPATHDYSRGLILELEHQKGKPFVARMLKQYKRPDGAYGDRRGSLQILPSGNVFMAWTDGGYLSEHTDHDEVVMEARWLKEGRFGTYRGFKHDGWVGRPKTPPDVKAIGYRDATSETTVTAIYVSWNGATEVRRWRFSVGGTILGAIDKTGFETVFTVLNASGTVIVEAFDKNGKSIGNSEDVEIEWTIGEGASSGTTNMDNSLDAVVYRGLSTHRFLFMAMVLLSLVGLGTVFWVGSSWLVRFKRRRRRAGSYTAVPMEESIGVGVG